MPATGSSASGTPSVDGNLDGQVAAAVLVPLYLPADASLTAADPQVQPRPAQLDQLRVVLTRRRDDLRRHAGEISFPGGRRDPEDVDLYDTALREAEEEIGLARADVTLLGALPPVSTFVTNYLIHPFVGLIPPDRQWTISAQEVDEVLDLSLAHVHAAKTRTPMQRRGFTFETDAYILDRHLIWGATARILEQLLERVAPLQLTSLD